MRKTGAGGVKLGGNVLKKSVYFENLLQSKCNEVSLTPPKSNRINITKRKWRNCKSKNSGSGKNTEQNLKVETEMSIEKQTDRKFEGRIRHRRTQYKSIEENVAKNTTRVSTITSLLFIFLLKFRNSF